MESPGSISSNILQSRVSAWSDIDPAYNWDINVTAPVGQMPTKTLNVLRCL